MTLAEKIAAARKQGISDADIWARVQASPEYSQAIAGGHTPSDIGQHLGFKSDVFGTPASVGGGATQSSDAISAENPDPLTTSNVGRKTTKVGELIGAGLVKGAAEGSIGLPGSILSMEQQYLPTKVTNFLRDNPSVNMFVNGPLGVLDSAMGGDTLPTGQSIEGHLNDWGIDAGAPVGRLEHLVDAASRGAGAGIVTAPLGGMGLVSGGLSGAAQGSAAEYAHQLAPTGPLSTIAPIAAGMAAGLPIGGGAAYLANRATGNLLRGAEGEAALKTQNFLNMQGRVKEAQDELASLQQAKVDMGLKHRQDVIDETTAHQNLVKSVTDDANQRIAAITAPADKTISDIADAHGTSQDFQQAGTALQDDATKWLGQMDAKQSAIWQPVDAKIPNSTPMTLDNFKAALNDINSHGGVLEPLNRYFKPQIANQLEDTLGHIEAGQQTGIVAPLTYADMRTLRTSLGKALSDPKILASLGDSNARQLYGALTQDIRSGIKPLGLADEFDAANAASTKLYDFAGNDLSKIVKSGTDRGNLDPEVIGNRIAALGKRGGTLLQSLREQMPDSVNELASTIIRSGKWADMSPEAKAALVPDVDRRAALEGAVAAKTSGAAPIQAEAQAKIDASKQDLAVSDLARKIKVLDHDNDINAVNKKITERQAQADIVAQAKSDAEGALERLREGTARRNAGKVTTNQLLKSDLLGKAGGVITNFLGIPDALSSAVQMGLGALPLIPPAAAFLARNPDLVIQPARGGYIGNVAVGNALAPGGSVPGKRAPLALTVRPKGNALGP